MKRKYKTGTAWCLWRWTDTDSGYLTRLHLVKTPWFALCLHWINKPDAEPYVHNHPVTFLSIILRGGYTEQRPDGFHRRRFFNFVKASTLHRITSTLPRTLTLAFMGPKTQEWGFQTPDGFVHWQEYYRNYQGRTMR